MLDTVSEISYVDVPRSEPYDWATAAQMVETKKRPEQAIRTGRFPIFSERGIQKRLPKPRNSRLNVSSQPALVMETWNSVATSTRIGEMETVM